IYNLIIIKKQPKSIKIITFFALAFGLIHGIGFSSYFKIMVNDIENKALPLIEFAIGIEIAQLIVVLCILVLNFIVLNILNKSKRDWIMVVSSIVIGIIIPMIIERKFW
ncbi:MAG: HupE/UreJ family protein, partial [Flavobacteriaceae bacterium]|nr:HupE/UreJ family protein [Flavobacteriaceae bacterium]